MATLCNYSLRLNYVILRPAIVYGVADRLGLTPRLIVGAVYGHLKEKMKVILGTDLIGYLLSCDSCYGLKI